MTTLRGFWRNIWGQMGVSPAVTIKPDPASAVSPVNTFDLDIAPHDPLLAYVQQSPGVINVDQLKLDSPALEEMRRAGIKLIVPLVSQGELIGLINLGGRLSEQEYSRDDYKLLSDLATQAAPALRVAQLVKQQQIEAAERERIQQELKVARLIQQTLLPQSVPDLAGYRVSAFYQPARAVGGDFYDFIRFPDGKIGFIVADVTDKGVPAALVMATTRSILRAAAERLESPGAVLARTNEILVKEIPPKMFVTCFFAVLDPASGLLQYANAGHDVPYRYTADGVVELRATGMPLGLLPGMGYEEKETRLKAGEYVLLYSDGLVEAHNREREMFGFPRLQALLSTHPAGSTLKDFLLEELASFTGPGWEQEDDVTLVTLQRDETRETKDNRFQTSDLRLQTSEGSARVTSFEVVSAPGNERQAMERVAKIVGGRLPADRLERLKTAVAEATMNAMEHGNRFDAGKPTRLTVTIEPEAVRIAITDQGGGPPVNPAVTPDLDAKLRGDQSPRGWGLFLIQNMVDEMEILQDEKHHTIELVMNRDRPGGLT